MKKMVLFCYFVLLSLNLLSQDKKTYTDSALYYLNNPAHSNCLKCRYNDSAIYYLNLQDYKNAAIILEKLQEFQSDTDWFTPLNLGQVYMRLGKYDQVEKFLKIGLHILEQKGDTNNYNYLIPLFSLGSYYYIEKNDLVTSEKILKRTLLIRQKNNLVSDPQYFVIKLFLLEICLDKHNLQGAINICRNIKSLAENENVSITTFYEKYNLPIISQIFTETGKNAFDLQDYTNAVYTLNEAKKIKEFINAYDSDYVLVIFELGKSYSEIENVDTAKKLFQSCVELFDLLSSSSALNDLIFTEICEIYKKTDPNKAEETLIKGVKMISEKYGNENESLFQILRNTAWFYAIRGDNSKSTEYIKKALVVQEILHGKNNREYVDLLVELSDDYSWDLDFSIAEECINEALTICSQYIGSETRTYASCLKSKAKLLYRLGNYQKSIELLNESIDIQLRRATVDTMSLISCKLDLVSNYKDMGDISSATEECNKIGKLFEKSEKYKRNAFYPVFLNSFAGLLFLTNDFENSEKLYLLSLSESKDSNCLINLSNLYLKKGEIEKAKDCIITDLLYYERNKNTSQYIRALKHLATIQHAIGEVNEAIKTLNNALSLENENYFENYFEKTITLTLLACLLEEIGKYKEAHDCWAKNFNIIRTILNNKMLILSDKDKILFLNKYASISNDLNSKMVFNEQNLNLSEISYNNELQNKQVVLRSYGVLKNSILLINNVEIKNKFDSLITVKKRLAYNYSLPKKEGSNKIKVMEEEEEDLEKYLIKNFAKYKSIDRHSDVNWIDISKKLKFNEAAIEITKCKIGGDTSVYAALLLSSKYTLPKYIYLFFAEKEFDRIFSRPDTTSESDIFNKLYSYNKEGNSLNTWIWSHFDSLLPGINTIYIAPTGLINNLNLSAIPLNEKLNFGEKYDLHIVGTTADIIDYKPTYINRESIKQMIIYGGVDFDNSANKPSIEPEIDTFGFKQVAEIASRSSLVKFGYLPGTKEEAKNIQQLFKTNGILNIFFTGENATEASLKQLNGKKDPFILHIATHGYFFPDTEHGKQKKLLQNFLEPDRNDVFKWSDQPLLRSGLIFAGANHRWGKTDYVSNNTEDGILTSYEISNLDLGNCQLVVLSACETGLGDIKGSEGVFGLQRAFKMAGVKNIIMSLWEVPDEQTSELMTLFYNYCFSGKSVHDALQAAQNDMKKKYPPYYWAGFKLLE